jgi:dihydrofolate reductase
MGDVVAHMAMSLDGFVADPEDRCDDLFGFYVSGDVSAVLGEGQPELRMAQPTADLVLDAVQRVGATLIGRRLYDHTNGWGGHPPGEVPMVVLTHTAPKDHPRDGVPIHFVDDVARAVALALELADGKDVSVAGAQASRACLDAGLLDVIQVSLVPVILGAGIAWFAGADGPVRLHDPEVVEAPGVTHLRYRVQR